MRIFSTDHKVIGLQYGFTSLGFLMLGFLLILLVRWQLAFPLDPVPIVAKLLGDANAPGGILMPEFYTQLGAMHGTIMVFLAVVPLAVGALDRKSTRLNSSHTVISYAVFCLKK